MSFYINKNFSYKIKNKHSCDPWLHCLLTVSFAGRANRSIVFLDLINRIRGALNNYEKYKTPWKTGVWCSRNKLRSLFFFSPAIPWSLPGERKNKSKTSTNDWPMMAFRSESSPNMSVENLFIFCSPPVVNHPSFDFIVYLSLKRTMDYKKHSH